MMENDIMTGIKFFISTNRYKHRQPEIWLLGKLGVPTNVASFCLCYHEVFSSKNISEEN